MYHTPTRNPSTSEEETRKPDQNHSQFSIKFETSLGYMKSCLKTNKNSLVKKKKQELKQAYIFNSSVGGGGVRAKQIWDQSQPGLDNELVPG